MALQNWKGVVEGNQGAPQMKHKQANTEQGRRPADGRSSEARRTDEEAHKDAEARLVEERARNESLAAKLAVESRKTKTLGEQVQSLEQKAKELKAQLRNFKAEVGEALKGAAQRERDHRRELELKLEHQIAQELEALCEEVLPMPLGDGATAVKMEGRPGTRTGGSWADVDAGTPEQAGVEPTTRVGVTEAQGAGSASRDQRAEPPHLGRGLGSGALINERNKERDRVQAPKRLEQEAGDIKGEHSIQDAAECEPQGLPGGTANAPSDTQGLSGSKLAQKRVASTPTGGNHRNRWVVKEDNEVGSGERAAEVGDCCARCANKGRQRGSLPAVAAALACTPAFGWEKGQQKEQGAAAKGHRCLGVSQPHTPAQQAQARAAMADHTGGSSRALGPGLRQ
jgi:hypothetical protein